MIQTDLELALRDLPNVAEPLRRDERRSIWRFRAAGQELLLYHFRRGGRFSLNPALQMFTRAQTLAKLGVPTPRVAAQLTGLKVGDEFGDAVIVEALPVARQLDRVLHAASMNGDPLPKRVSWSQQIAAILVQLGAAKWRFPGVTLASFLVANDRIYLHDLRGLQRDEVRLNDVWALAADAQRFASRTELLRSWRALNPDGLLPKRNPRSGKVWRAVEKQADRDGPFASRIKIDGWSGVFTHTKQFEQPWTIASQLGITAGDWQSQFPMLLADLLGGKLTPIKQDTSGEVYSATVTLAGRRIDVIVKRPFRKLWYRYITDVTRGAAKAQRTYRKAWQLIARNVPCEWPLLMMEKKVAGYVLDGIVVFERVPGTRLDQIHFDAMDPKQRDAIFRRCGRTTRKIELGGLAHYDAKTTNWIIYDSPNGPLPIIIDVDGVRPLTNGLVAFGVRRLLRALQTHSQFTPADSLAVCQGYAPFARGLIRESEPTA